jgi:proline dehydrogenase/hydroxyproline oxidase
LLRSTVVLHACASDGVVSAATSLLTRATAGAAPPLLARAALVLAHSTVIRQFVAGERLADVHGIAAQLLSTGVRCIVDHSTEESEAAGARAGNLQAKLDVLRLLSRELRGSCSFVPVKLTALVSPAQLERLAAALGSEPFPRSWGMEEAVTAAGLSSPERAELQTSVDGLRSLCSAAAEAGVGLLLDAEQTHRQPAIHLLARDLMREFNRDGRALVHDTHQAYLRGAQSRIEEELRRAQAGGYTLGVKLVRGAYRVAELARGSGHLLHDTKGGTDREYDGCAALLLGAAVRRSGGFGDGKGMGGSGDVSGDVKMDASGGVSGDASRGQFRDASSDASRGEAWDASREASAVGGSAAVSPSTAEHHAGCAGARPQASLVLATHNRASTSAIAEALRRSGHPPDQAGVHFAQILGARLVTPPPSSAPSGWKGGFVLTVSGWLPAQMPA